MSFITKNANILLLLLILVSAVALVFATLFFQSSFDEINVEYNAKMDELERVSAALKNYTAELDIKSKREKEISEQYTVVQSEKEQIASEKQSLESSVETLESKVASKESALIAALDKIDSLEVELVDKDQDLQNCEVREAKLLDDIGDLEDDLAACNSS